MKCYITFGTAHSHIVNGIQVGANHVVVIKGKDYGECREKAFDVFGPKFAFIYPEGMWQDSDMTFYPGGYVELEG